MLFVVSAQLSDVLAPASLSDAERRTVERLVAEVDRDKIVLHGSSLE